MLRINYLGIPLVTVFMAIEVESPGYIRVQTRSYSGASSLTKKEGKVLTVGIAVTDELIEYHGVE